MDLHKTALLFKVEWVVTNTKGEKDNMENTYITERYKATLELINELIDELQEDENITKAETLERQIILEKSKLELMVYQAKLLSNNVHSFSNLSELNNKLFKQITKSEEYVLGRKEVEEMIASIDSAEKLKEVSTIVINVNLEKDQSAEDIAIKLADTIKNRGGKI